MARLGLVLDQILFKSRAGHSTDEVFVRFVENVVERRFERVAFCSRVVVTERAAPYLLDPSRFEIVPLPWYRDIPELCMKAPLLLPRIARILGAEMSRWDLVLAFGVHPLSSLALRMARRNDVPAVFWVRGDILTDLAHRLTGTRRLLGSLVARLCLAAIPSGTPVVSMGRGDYPFLRRMGALHVAYSSKFGDADVLPLPRPSRDPEGPSRILYVGRVAPEKGIEVLLAAVSMLRSQAGSSVEVTFVGSDFHGATYGETFARRVRESGLADVVHMKGHVPYGPALMAQYDAHDVLVLPSFTEGFPQVILEAMARGIPVVATKVGGVPRVVEDGHNGLLVPPGDPEALGAAICRILNEPALARRLAQEGQAAVREFTRERQVGSIDLFLKRCFPQAPFARD